MKLLQIIILIASLTGMIFFTHGCDKDNKLDTSGKELEFYILDSFKTAQGSDMIVESTVYLNDTALITYKQIIGYDRENHIFIVDESVAAALNDEGGLKYFFKAFALCIDKEIIYTGYFWPSISSSIKRWFVIDPVLYFNTNELKVQKAYPSDDFAGEYPDLRNDYRIIALLRGDGKLKN